MNLEETVPPRKSRPLRSLKNGCTHNSTVRRTQLLCGHNNKASNDGGVEGERLAVGIEE